MTSTLMILGAWFAVSAVLCLLLGAVVRHADQGLDAATAPAAHVVPATAGPGAVAPAAAIAPAPTTRPVEVVAGGSLA